MLYLTNLGTCYDCYLILFKLLQKCLLRIMIVQLFFFLILIYFSFLIHSLLERTFVCFVVRTFYLHLSPILEYSSYESVFVKCLSFCLCFLSVKCMLHHLVAEAQVQFYPLSILLESNASKNALYFVRCRARPYPEWYASCY